MPKALLFDSTLCIGCKSCEGACAEKNKLAYTDAIAAQEKTSAEKFNSILTRDEKFMRRSCMHCNDPSCVSVCPVAALQKTPAGPVIYLEDRCMGCRYCMVACPFNVPKYQWDAMLPLVRKCTFCDDRVSAGQPSACAEACPTGATKFGERDALLQEAQERIRQNPGNYVDHIYGAEELGGTSVLLLSSVPFETFGYRVDYSDDPLPILTHSVLKRIPDVVTLGGVVLGGVWWITKRRDEVAAAENNENQKEGRE